MQLVHFLVKYINFIFCKSCLNYVTIEAGDNLFLKIVKRAFLQGFQSRAVGSIYSLPAKLIEVQGTFLLRKLIILAFLSKIRRKRSTYNVILYQGLLQNHSSSFYLNICPFLSQTNSQQTNRNSTWHLSFFLVILVAVRNIFFSRILSLF